MKAGILKEEGQKTYMLIDATGKQPRLLLEYFTLLQEEFPQAMMRVYIESKEGLPDCFRICFFPKDGGYVGDSIYTRAISYINRNS